MTDISVLGGGAFGTSLALALSRDGANVTLWSRSKEDVQAMNASRTTGIRLPGHSLSETLHVTHDLGAASQNVCLLAIPMQKLRQFLQGASFSNLTLVACCKGIDLETGLGPIGTLEQECPACDAAILTGPSFAADIAQGLPTALTLATKEDVLGAHLQEELSRPRLRLYRTNDVVGAELGGALKNVVGLAAGMAIGAGFGDSARASVIARGFAEMVRYAGAQGAQRETLQGLSGLGDLVLTCTSDKSRNFTAGVKIGAGQALDEMTIEGIPTAEAVAKAAGRAGISMPLTKAVAAVTSGDMDVHEAVSSLLARPAGKE